MAEEVFGEAAGTAVFDVAEFECDSHDDFEQHGESS
jgi:hypothetical protein